ncbi:MAG: prephenate dehydrogenase/arogenate dehydrogenase family protein, partial [Acidimicrobiia bacterium]|nr:prephenate dehydrogenase/arogenate dehydrogenase family protein [Acidimicrobiia bacterium]
MADDEPAGCASPVGVIGLGLIGGSVAGAVLAAGGAVVGWDPDPATRDHAAAAGVTIAPSPEAVVAAVADGGVADRADDRVVVVAAPLDDAPGVVAAALATGGPDGPTVTDVASVKGPVLAAAAGHPAYVTSHPMAGTERSGWAAASPTLFVGAPWLVLVDDDTALSRIAAVARLVLALGARPVPLDPAGHDAVLATISHLPHVLAALLTLQAGPALPLAAGSLHGAARVAAGD